VITQVDHLIARRVHPEAEFLVLGPRNMIAHIIPSAIRRAPICGRNVSEQSLIIDLPDFERSKCQNCWGAIEPALMQ